MTDFLYSELELKFSEEDDTKGTFSGYAAVFNNVDSHEDIILPGAFKETLSELKAEGRRVPLHVMHRVYGGDGVPVGIIPALEEDSVGLKMTGKISGMNTDAGKLLYERAKDGAFGGLSIGYKIKPGGARKPRGGEQGKRILTNLALKEISLVDTPSNAMSRASDFKSDVMAEFKELMKLTDVKKASSALAEAVALHFKTLSGGNSPNSEERQALLNSLCDAHEALTGQRMPEGLKSAPATIREFEDLLREKFGFSNAEARQIAEGGYKSLSTHRDDADDEAKRKEEADKAELAKLLS